MLEKGLWKRNVAGVALFIKKAVTDCLITEETDQLRFLFGYDLEIQK